MNFYIKSLGREIEIETFMKETIGLPAIIVKHNSLVDIYNNVLQEDPDLGIMLNYNPVHISMDHNVWIVIISDNHGRRVQGIGESIPTTLESNIDKSYPSKIAANRAFDAAMIQYLNLPAQGRVLSNLEISQEEIASLVPEEKKMEVSETPAIKTEDEEMVIPEITMGDIEEDVEAVFGMNAPEVMSVSDTNILEGTPFEGMEEDGNLSAEIEEMARQKEAEELEKMRATVLTFGKHKGKTYKETYDAQPSYFTYLFGKAPGKYPALEKYVALEEKAKEGVGEA